MHPSLRSIDWISFLLTLLLACTGVFFIFSATYKPELPFSLFFKKQLVGFSLGIIIYWIFSFADYRTLMRWGYFAYIALIGLLCFTLVKGSIGMGGQRWVNLGLFKLQPSELTKLLFPALTVYYIQTNAHQSYARITHFIPLLSILALSFVLVLKQPDLGTALIILFCGLTMIWLAGMPKRFFIAGALGILICAPILWHGLKEYQRKRISVFLGYGDSQKERYQIEQAAIAIGSGGLWGKGFLKGTQNTLQFLPESRTDFIFAVICEELGLIGALLIIFLYILLFIRIISQILLLTDAQIQLLAIGLLMHCIISCIINIGMVLGLLPVVGIPLPLISYGISNLWITFATLGWIQGIIIQRRNIEKYSGNTVKNFANISAHTML